MYALFCRCSIAKNEFSMFFVSLPPKLYFISSPFLSNQYDFQPAVIISRRRLSLCIKEGVFHVCSSVPPPHTIPPPVTFCLPTLGLNMLHILFISMIGFLFFLYEIKFPSNFHAFYPKALCCLTTHLKT